MYKCGLCETDIKKDKPYCYNCQRKYNYDNAKPPKASIPIRAIDNSFITGCLLGDSSIQKTGRICTLRAQADLEYLKFQHQRLKPYLAENNKIGMRGVYDNRTNKTYYCCSFMTRNTIEFYNLRQYWYPHGKKIVPNIKIDPEILSIWFHDDGYISRTTINACVVGLSTHCFTKTEVLYLKESLSEFLNCKFNMYTDDGHQFKLRTCTDGAIKLCRVVNSYFPSDLKTNKLEKVRAMLNHHESRNKY